MIRYRLVAPFMLGLMLAACGKGGASVSGSASETAGSSSGLSSIWEQMKSLGIETGKTYEMPALGIMADAFLGDADARGIRLDAIPSLVMRDDGNGIARFDTALLALIEPTARDVAAIAPAELARATPLDAEHMIYAGPIIVAMQPRKGWGVQAIDDTAIDPRFDTPFFRQHRRQSSYNRDTHLRYMEMLAASAIYANTVFGLIDTALGTVRLAAPDVARQKVLAAFQAIPAATLKSILVDACEHVTHGSFSTDLTGSGNIHFTHSPAGDFVADPRGTTWTKAGGIWFGDGRLNGQTVTIRLASTSTLSQRQAQSGTQGATADAKVGGSGTVKPGQ